MSAIVSLVRHPIRERFLPKAMLASDLVLWLFWLPVALRIFTIPRLLERLAHSRRDNVSNSMDLKEAIKIATRLCNLRPFRSRIFPQRCLRQSLTLYRTLNRMGYSVELHFGIYKKGEELRGHSWVTIEGKPVAERTRTEIFKPIYSYRL
jgi:Transglutaminase-like superfamily